MSGMDGIFYGIGVGPGDPENLTLKAVNTIKACDVIAVPGKELQKTVSYNIVKRIIDDIDEKQILCLDMPMTKDNAILEAAHSKAAQSVAEELKKGRNVAFITLGDPCIYSTYIYIQRLIEKSGYSTKIINGIPAMCAVASGFNVPLGLEDEEIHIIPFLKDVSILSSLNGTKVIMKPSANYEEIKDYLIKNNITAVMVENAGMSTERKYGSPEEFPDKIGYLTTIIVRHENKFN